MRWKIAKDAQSDVLPATKSIVGKDTSRQCPGNEKTVPIIEEKISQESSSYVIKNLFQKNWKKTRR